MSPPTDAERDQKHLETFERCPHCLVQRDFPRVDLSGRRGAIRVNACNQHRHLLDGAASAAIDRRPADVGAHWAAVGPDARCSRCGSETAWSRPPYFVACRGCGRVASLDHKSVMFYRLKRRVSQLSALLDRALGRS